MFVGHFAVGFAGKSMAPRASLGMLMVAPLLLDMLWPIFLATGAESVRIVPGITAVNPLDLHHYPYSHSLVTSLGWSLGLGLLYYAVTRYKRESVVIALAVFSHWILDFVSHRPDMPIVPGGSARVGLGLWNSVGGTILVEGALFFAGVFSYAKNTTARTRRGGIGFWSLVMVLAVMYAANFFAPPPPSVEMLIISAFAMWLFVPWAWWVDRNRSRVVL
ncbi:MAG: hypothetical protein HY698_03835 [Deltaproteobacteria bacterium]|nr:hypothetical protein [Deltaproteobacteria bacterium]